MCIYFNLLLSLSFYYVCPAIVVYYYCAALMIFVLLDYKVHWLYQQPSENIVQGDNISINWMINYKAHYDLSSNL